MRASDPIAACVGRTNASTTDALTVHSSLHEAIGKGQKASCWGRAPECQWSIPLSTILSFGLPPSPPNTKLMIWSSTRDNFSFTTASRHLNIEFWGRGGDQNLKLVLWSVVRRGHCRDRCVRRPPRTSHSEVPGPRGKNTRRNIGYRLDTVRNAWENTGYRQSN